MKKIPLWKMVVLSIVTLGLYEFYWLAVQKKPLEKITQSKLPPTGWLISAAVSAVVSYALIILIYIIPESNWAGVLLATLAFLFFLSYAGITWIWWTIVFLKAANSILAPRVTFGWMMIHLFTLGLVIYIAQYYFNRKPDPKQKAPSTRFITLSLVFIIGAYVLGAAFFVSLVVSSFNIEYSAEQQKQDVRSTQLDELSKKTYLLDKKYNGCTQQLDLDFPTVNDETEEAYSSGYDACEAIRIEQNKAVSEYDALYNQVSY